MHENIKFGYRFKVKDYDMGKRGNFAVDNFSRGGNFTVGRGWGGGGGKISGKYSGEQFSR